MGKHNYPDQWTKHNAQESGYGGEAIENRQDGTGLKTYLSGTNII